MSLHEGAAIWIVRALSVKLQKTGSLSPAGNTILVYIDTFGQNSKFEAACEQVATLQQ